MSLMDWAEREKWLLTVADAEKVAETLAPLGTGCTISGDHRP